MKNSLPGWVAHKGPCMNATVTLYYFEYVDNNSGIWNRSWYPTEVGANNGRRLMIDALGADEDDALGQGDGQYGQVGEVHTESVPLTAEGILNFANNYATEDDGI